VQEQEKPTKEGFFARLKRSLLKTKENLGSGFISLFRGKKIDDDLFEELEEQLLIAFLVWPMCRESWRDKESHGLRLVTITVLSIIPIALMVLTATGYFYTTLRLAGRWIETVYLVILWNLLYQTVLRGLSVAARRIAWRRALARRQNLVKEGAEGAEPQEEPTIALEQVNQQTLR
ncbi:hypothetical protein P7M08_25100, partial [Vibrio parahaemolyticus]|nr:hypothetical protein [Vibrio parahaemolyticus]